jgi:cytochrome b
LRCVKTEWLWVDPPLGLPAWRGGRPLGGCIVMRVWAMIMVIGLAGWFSSAGHKWTIGEGWGIGVSKI